MSLLVPSQVIFVDNVLDTKGQFELADNTKMIIEDVMYFNNSAGLNALGFQANLSEKQISTLANNQVSIIEPNILLASSFSTRKQKQQKTIFNCLYNQQ